MLKKAILKNALKLWKKANFNVKYWDGELVSYGDNPKFTVIFNQEPSTEDLHTDLVLTIGGAYMKGIVDFEGSMDDIIKTMYDNNHSTLTVKELEDKLKLFAVDEKQEIKAEKDNIHSHYDLGNDFYRLWLDPTMSYSCAYFENDTDTLETAQLQKIDHSLGKLNLKPGEHLLDIGCGWGWLVIRAAQKYGVKATGITLSEEQYAGATERIKKLGLEDLVDIRLQNYIEIDHTKEQFDKIISIGMFEHVGKKRLAAYLAKVNLMLKDKGVFLLHAIMCQMESESNPWIVNYIFPGGYIPSLSETLTAGSNMGYQVQHIENLRRHYAKTLDKWYENYKQVEEKVIQTYGKEFSRMWGLYLSGCASAFRMGNIDIYQILYTKGTNNDMPMTYGYMYNK